MKKQLFGKTEQLLLMVKYIMSLTIIWIADDKVRNIFYTV